MGKRPYRKFLCFELYDQQHIRAPRDKQGMLRDLIKVTEDSPEFRDVLEKVTINTALYDVLTRPSLMAGAGNGVFNTGKKTIPKNTPLCIYSGMLEVKPDEHGSKKKAYKHTDYRAGLGKHTFFHDELGELGFDLDVIGEPSKDKRNANNLNHSCAPNCVWTLIEVPNGLSFGVLETKRDIEPGEECTWDYGREYWKPLQEMQYPPEGYQRVTCQCGHCPEPLAIFVPIPDGDSA